MSDPSTQASSSTPTPAQAVDGVPPSSPPAGDVNWRALLTVFLVVFIDLLGFGIVLPLLSLYGDSYVAQLIPGGKDAPAGGAILGLLMASFSAMQFIFAPIWGRLSDRIGRRPVLLVGLAGSVVFYVLFGYASDLPRTAEMAGLALTLLFAARTGAGIAGATIATAQAVIADSTPPEKRKHGMALIGAAFGIGFTFGPLIGAGSLYLFPQQYGIIGYTAAGLSLIALILGMMLMPETRRFGAAPLARKWFDTQAIRNVLRNPAVAPVVWTFFLATLGFASFEVTMSLLNRDALRLQEKNNFLIFAYIGFTLMLAQGVLYRRLANRVSEVTFMAMGMILMGLGVLSLGLISWLAMLGRPPEVLGQAIGPAIHSVPSTVGFGVLLPCVLIALTFAVVGFAFLTPSAQALISRRSDPELQGEVLGVNQSASALARILGPIFGLTLYKATQSHLLPYVFGAALLLMMLPLIPRIRRGG
jgi:MFS transporter, DHA1 family, tetracycline resistance protein